MSEFEQYFCPNKQCKDYGLRGHGNIGIRAKYGKDKNRDLLYCRTCGKRFAAYRASALFGLHLPAETIRQIIHHTADGVGVRATARLLIAFWIGRVAQPDDQHRLHRAFQFGLATMGCPSCAQSADGCPLDALAQGQVCHLRGLL